MKEVFRKLMKLVPQDVSERIKLGVDFLLYLFLPKKTIVIILCCIRSGSTLLKALLAEAPDISHLPEIDYQDYYTNKYSFYRRVYFLSKKRIIVLKSPHWFKNATVRRFIPDIRHIKIVILTRDVFDVVKSLRECFQVAKFKDLGKEGFVNYWCDVYECILDSIKKTKKEVCVIRYEDLVSKPKEITSRLFSFVGSSKRDGVDCYHEPEDFKWKWGSDDGGDKIKHLKVVTNRGISNQSEIDKELTELITTSKRAAYLRHSFGYIHDKSNSVPNRRSEKLEKCEVIQ
jgi:hypothetical protein